MPQLLVIFFSRLWSLIVFRHVCLCLWWEFRSMPQSVMSQEPLCVTLWYLFRSLSQSIKLQELVCHGSWWSFFQSVTTHDNAWSCLSRPLMILAPTSDMWCFFRNPFTICDRVSDVLWWIFWCAPVTVSDDHVLYLPLSVWEWQEQLTYYYSI